MEAEGNRIPIAIYGLGTETQRMLSAQGKDLNIVGLLDGFRMDGEIYGYPIISLQLAIEQGVKKIIVVARPGSCKAIAKRIGDTCRDNCIALLDVRGRDLLNPATVTYDFNSVNGDTKKQLLEKVNASDIISFDLFDTLIMRKTKLYTDVFELLDFKLREKGIFIPDFATKRLFAEKELSKEIAPRLEQIYEYLLKCVGGSFISSFELADMEQALDFSLLTVRNSMKEVYQTALSSGKNVVIIPDSYYSKEQIARILDHFGLIGYDDLFVSCEYGTAKSQQLFGILIERYKGKSILHVGDDEYVDIEKAKSNGIATHKIYSAVELFDALGGLGMENEIISIADHVKLGLFFSDIFNNPFWFDEEERRLSVKDAYDIGYLFCAPMIIDFTLWLKENSGKQGYNQILFGSRDGYLVGQLFRMIDISKDSFYFLVSRTAAIRAGMESQEDIDYVDGMKYFGTPEDAMRIRFGIEIEDVNSIDRSAVILKKAERQREYYQNYIRKLGIGDGKIALFDFVAKGTTQMYLKKLFPQHMKGFYFLQLEPEFMSEKGLDIEPFYTDAEKEKSAIFDNYYIDKDYSYMNSMYALNDLIHGPK